MLPDGGSGVVHEDVGYGFVDPLVRGCPPVLDGAENLRVKADAFKAKANAIHTRAQSVHTIWQRLGAHYHAPEQEILLAAMTKPEAAADGIATDVGSAVKALKTFADALDGLARRRAELLTRGVDINIDHQAFQDEFPNFPFPTPGELITGLYDGADSQHEKLTGRAEKWNADMAQFVEDNFDSQRECINSISAIYGGQPLRGEEDATAADKAAGRVYGGDASTYIDAVRFGVADRATANAWADGAGEVDVQVWARGQDATNLSRTLDDSAVTEIDDPEEAPAAEDDFKAAAVDALITGLAAGGRGRGLGPRGRIRGGGRGLGGELPDMTLLYRVDGTVATGPKSSGATNDLARAQGVATRFSGGSGPAYAASALAPSTWGYMMGLKKSPSRSTWEYVAEQQRRRTVAQRFAPKQYDSADVKAAYDSAKKVNGVPVDYRTGYALDGGTGADRGWFMKWDPDGNKGAGEWVPENPGRGLPNNKYPSRGAPNSIGYDSHGKRLPYANYRPELKEETINKVYAKAKDSNGHVQVITLPKQQLYTQTLTTDDPPRRDVIWAPGMDRAWTGGPIEPNMWDMGHDPENKYSDLLHRYLNHEIDSKAFIDEYNDAGNYQVEDPMYNRSHTGE